MQSNLQKVEKNPIRVSRKRGESLGAFWGGEIDQAIEYTIPVGDGEDFGSWVQFCWDNQRGEGRDVKGRSACQTK